MAKQTKYFRTSRNFDQTKEKGETRIGKNMTNPDDAYSLRDLIAKYAGGIVPNIERTGHFQDQENIDIEQPTAFPLNYDLADATAYMHDLNASIEENRLINEDNGTGNKTTESTTPQTEVPPLTPEDEK